MTDGEDQQNEQYERLRQDLVEYVDKRLGEDEQYERLRQGLVEYVKVATDTQKHLTTLSAGSLVLIGTFLKDIFSATTLDVEWMGVSIIKWLIALSFLFFVVSLVVSAWLIGRFRGLLVSAAKGEKDFQALTNLPAITQRYTRYAAFFSFALGLALFGFAVVINLFLG
jgi:hypothetical protein